MCDELGSLQSFSVSNQDRFIKSDISAEYQIELTKAEDWNPTEVDSQEQNFGIPISTNS
jgi:hypothetical protein